MVERPGTGAAAFPICGPAIGQPPTLPQPFRSIALPAPLSAVHVTHRLEEDLPLRFLRALVPVLSACVPVGMCLFALQHAPLPERQPERTTHILNMVEHDGAAQTAQALSRQKGWADVQHAVASGQPDAARLVPALLPAADSRTTRTLYKTMQAALPKHPAIVLAATKHGGPVQADVQAVCSPIGMSHAWRQQARQAVAHVHDVHLSDRAQRCLNRLDG
ncbi:hypothetical protein [Acetobacter pasteurianus]|uniref:hypothetical protein n=1 Tax=Acetobacter pasteurianus TaxID=438 RepID=UPI000AB7B542|nr:hypothetical protein [Acetobacter pasteurianus]